MYLSKNFHLSEFICKCGKCKAGDTNMDKELIMKLQVLRDKLGKPLHINSGQRCQKHNRHVGGSKLSYHLIGKACDVSVTDREDRLKLVTWALEIGLTVGVNFSFLHFDTRKYQTIFSY